MAYCPRCGGEVPADANFCPRCGAGAPGRAPAPAVAAVPAPPAAAPAAPEEVLFEGHPKAVASVGDLLLSVLTVGIYLLIRWIGCSASRFKVTTQRVELELGLFSKRHDVLWLYRVEDLELERPFGQRLLGTGNLKLLSSDKTTPDLVLAGLPDPVHLYDRLRASVERERVRRQVRLVDLEGGGAAGQVNT